MLVSVNRPTAGRMCFLFSHRCRVSRRLPHHLQLSRVATSTSSVPSSAGRPPSSGTQYNSFQRRVIKIMN